MNYRSKLACTAKSDNIIEIYVNKEFSQKILKSFRLYENGVFLKKLKPVSQSESHSSNIYTILLEDVTYVPGKDYEILTEDNFFIPVDISYLAKTEAFEKKYRFDGVLGAIYGKEKTVFRVFSPFASEMVLRLRRKGSAKVEAFEMEHNLDNGVFSVEVNGDLDEAMYIYQAKIFGIGYDVRDPYSLALDSNSRHGYVIDPEKVRAILSHEESLPAFDDRTKAIIYECHVRDMTSKTDLPNKGTYAALSEEGLVDKNKMPVGLDYLASLGVTHVQLLPILDYQSVNDDDPKSQYNWGYDPEFFFAPEGSLSTDPSSPYCRVLELRTLASALHQKGMRVVYDVVYNHVFSDFFNPLGILVPNYCYRFTDNGSLSNGSGCGNDLESRHYMVRKLIVDSLLHLQDFYLADGFRFDLMGILDIQTVKEAYERLSQNKPNTLFYGEGWDLWTSLPVDQKASYFNSCKMPFSAFFNDRFRDVVKGKSNESELGVAGYLLGDTNYRDGFKHVMLGSSVALSFAPLLSSSTQSLNFVECHDNNTLMDKIKVACPNDTDEEVDKRIRMIDVAVLMACGIPFFHAGQEIGLSKDGLPNTYNAGDKVNGFDYEVLYQRKELYQFFREAIQLKKGFIQACGKQYDELSRHMSFENLDQGALKVNYSFDSFELYLIFNPSKQSFMYSFDDYVSLVFTSAGNVEKSDFFIKMAIINSLSVTVFAKKKADTSLVYDKEEQK